MSSHALSTRRCFCPSARCSPTRTRTTRLCRRLPTSTRQTGACAASTGVAVASEPITLYVLRRMHVAVLTVPARGRRSYLVASDEGSVNPATSAPPPLSSSRTQRTEWLPIPARSPVPPLHPDLPLPRPFAPGTTAILPTPPSAPLLFLPQAALPRRRPGVDPEVRHVAFSARQFAAQGGGGPRWQPAVPLAAPDGGSAPLCCFPLKLGPVEGRRLARPAPARGRAPLLLCGARDSSDKSSIFGVFRAPVCSFRAPPCGTRLQPAVIACDGQLPFAGGSRSFPR